MVQLRTRPSHYIVLSHSPIIAGLMQVEIMAIISPAKVGDAGVFRSKSLCVEVDGSRLVNYRKLRAGYNAPLSSVSHLNPTSPPFTPSHHTVPLILSISPWLQMFTEKENVHFNTSVICVPVAHSLCLLCLNK